MAHVRHRSGIATWGDQPFGIPLRLELSAGGEIKTAHDGTLRSTSSFSIQVDSTTSERVNKITLAAVDDAGLRAAVGRLLRELRIGPGRVTIPHSFTYFEDSSAALWPMRGHQYTAAHYGSMFRTWEGFDTYTKDQAVFGTNQVELAHFAARASNLNNKHPTREPGIVVAELIEYSTRLNAAHMNVSFWWSLDIFQQHRSDTEMAWKGMPRIDSVFFPGGDGGALVWPDIAAAAAVLRKYHPNATVWVSAQEINATGLAEFYKTIDSPDVSCSNCYAEENKSRA